MAGNSKMKRTKVEIRLEENTLGAYQPSEEPIRTFVLRLVSHSRSIMSAKVDDNTALGYQGPGIAIEVMRRYALPTLTLEHPFDAGELIRAAESRKAAIRKTERE